VRQRNPEGFDDDLTRERLREILAPSIGDRADAAITEMEKWVFLILKTPPPLLHSRTRDALERAGRALEDLSSALHSEEVEPLYQVTCYVVRNGGFGPIPSADELAAEILSRADCPPFFRGLSHEEIANRFKDDEAERIQAATWLLGERNNGRNPIAGVLENMRTAIEALVEVPVRTGRRQHIHDKQITGIVADVLAGFGIELKRGRGETVFSRILGIVLDDVCRKSDNVAAPDDVDGLVRWAADIYKSSKNPAQNGG
jgi:hypothetical protein